MPRLRRHAQLRQLPRTQGGPGNVARARRGQPAQRTPTTKQTTKKGDGMNYIVTRETHPGWRAYYALRVRINHRAVDRRCRRIHLATVRDGYNIMRSPLLAGTLVAALLTAKA